MDLTPHESFEATQQLIPPSTPVFLFPLFLLPHFLLIFRGALCVASYSWIPLLLVERVESYNFTTKEFIDKYEFGRTPVIITREFARFDCSLVLSFF